ncbi:family 10 glycosylhydrolase [Nostoc linckia FACHB-104]|nr:family 10 glycosylhydrolase [Nostoc linckia FACHB-104]
MVSTSTAFSDIKGHWASSFIGALSGRRLINGYPNGTFRPDNSVTRAEFAALIAKVFTLTSKRKYSPFTDVPTNHWAANVIKNAYEAGFISGYPDKTFRPNNRISRGDVLVAIVNGLEIATKIKPDLVNKLSQYYTDATAIAGYAKNQVAIATSAGLVVSHPNIKLLNPNLAATRADLAVIAYQALVYQGKAEKITSTYLVPSPNPPVVVVPPVEPPQVEVPVEPPKVEVPVEPPQVEVPVEPPKVEVPVEPPQVEVPPTPPVVVTPVEPPKVEVPQNTVRLSHQREFRGAWVASVWNGDWPSKSGLPVAQQKSELVAIITRLQQLNFNALILQVRPEGDAVYASTLEPWSAWITGTQGKAPDPYYDPLEFAIAECHKRNIEVHAWFNPYRAKTSVNSGINVSPHIAVTNPDVVYKWGNQLWMDPGIKIVQDRAYNVILDVVRRYDIDGVHLDDYFYPYPISGQTFPDSKTYEAYKSAGGGLSLGDWRRENVNLMVLRLSEGIKATKPHVKFGISPFGIYRPGQPAGITGLDAYNVLYADSKKWLELGWVDYIAPQLYWRTDQTQQSYSALLNWWTQVNTKQKHVYAGNNLTEPSNKSRESEEIEKQVIFSRSQAGRYSLGNIFFNLGVLMENSQGIADKFQTQIYNKPAIPPTWSSQVTTVPAPPTGLVYVNGRLNWKPGDDQPVRSWTLYRQSGDGWVIQRILSAGTTFATVGPGTYAVCAVDRLANESQGVMITVN